MGYYQNQNQNPNYSRSNNTDDYYTASDSWSKARSFFEDLGLGFLTNPIGDAIDKKVNPGRLPNYQSGMGMNNIHKQRVYGIDQPEDYLPQKPEYDATGSIIEAIGLGSMLFGGGAGKAAAKGLGTAAKGLGTEASGLVDDLGTAAKGLGNLGDEYAEARRVSDLVNNSGAQKRIDDEFLQYKNRQNYIPPVIENGAIETAQGLRPPPLYYRPPAPPNSVKQKGNSLNSELDSTEESDVRRLNDLTHGEISGGLRRMNTAPLFPSPPVRADNYNNQNNHHMLNKENSVRSSFEDGSNKDKAGDYDQNYQNQNYQNQNVGNQFLNGTNHPTRNYDDFVNLNDINFSMKNTPLLYSGNGLGNSNSNGSYSGNGLTDLNKNYDDGGYVSPGLGSINDIVGNTSGIGLGSLNPNNINITRMSNPNLWQNPPYSANLPNGFSGMTPMFGTNQNQQTSPQQFARGGVANNFGRSRGRV